MLLALALSYGAADYIEGGVITAVVVSNVIIGFVQDRVLRSGNLESIPSVEVVPGDVVVIKTGDTISAALRMFESRNLECDEKVLTGDAIPVAKVPEADFSDRSELGCGVGDRISMAYSSSTVTTGCGRGIVVFTGMHTKIGKIAESMQGKKRKPNRSMSRKKHGKLQPVKGGALRTWDGIGKFLGLTEGTPLQIKLSKLAYTLFGGAIILAIIVYAVHKFDVSSEVAIYAISTTSIAIIPESLIAVLTITFVTGMTAMRRRRVLTRKLSALEALGGITNICSDKTGTLTQGLMTVRKAWVPGVGIYTVSNSEDPSNPKQGRTTIGPAKSKAEMDAEKRTREEHFDTQRSGAALKFDLLPTRPVTRHESNGSYDEKYAEDAEEFSQMVPELEALLRSAALCNLANVRLNEQEGKWQTTGDDGWKQISEYPFDSTVKRMSAVYKSPADGNTTIFTKGAVERILDLCDDLGTGIERQQMTHVVKESIYEQMRSLADQGLRVLALATKTWKGDFTEDTKRDDVESKLTLLECTNAGIKNHMLTGDHKATATAIGKEVGIIPRDFSTLPADVADSLVKTAAEFNSMSDEDIDAMPELPLVIARCAPHTKTRMIAALHRRKAYAAMTGNGVNDGPSLQAADVGIAMGMAGSDVAKDASDIVLTDDNFSSIVNAIEEGRRMFDNIQKFVLHLLTSNVGEVFLLIFSLGFRDINDLSVFPLSPLQILWINMITSGPPAFGLGLEKAVYNIMSRPPHNTKLGVFSLQIITDMIVYGHECNKTWSPSCDTVFRARSAVVAELTWLLLISAWEIKSIRRSMFRLDPHSSSRALIVFPCVYIPGFNDKVFKQRPISWEWALSVGAVVMFVAGIET
ncbi:hypothetical protein BDV96DRAFT_615125 [Lophiotrema nucula]|uniref:Uncharacterized protein n=1 Tax=Lophiotrema nucula TaxID=690887 RepID=A0A6A5YUU7_9PLEO|nr:hypothetical protein BDV96DRAFT_615125 [Lophiotrema nucula]